MSFAYLKQQMTSTHKSMAVAWAHDSAVLQSVAKALQLGYINEAVLIGEREALSNAAEAGEIDLAQFMVEEAQTAEEAAQLGVKFVRTGRCNLLMKGSLGTAVLLKAVLNKQTGIRISPLLSHIAVVGLPEGRLALLTDAAMNIAPDLGQKFLIVDNAIKFAWNIGIENPNVAILASLETVNPKMPDTVDAAALTQMANRGQFSKPAIVDGPLAFDNAFDKKAAQLKGITSSVAGYADLFVVPEITAGNILYKAFTYVANLETAGVIVGASCPIVLTSRSDSEQNKLNSILIASKASS